MARSRPFRTLFALCLVVPLAGCKMDLIFATAGTAPGEAATYVVRLSTDEDGGDTGEITFHVVADVPDGWTIEGGRFEERSGARGQLAVLEDPEIPCVSGEPLAAEPLPPVPAGHRRVAFRRSYANFPPGDHVDFELDLLAGAQPGSFSVRLHGQGERDGIASCDSVSAVTNVSSSLLFADGFEGGNTVAWSSENV